MPLGTATLKVHFRQRSEFALKLALIALLVLLVTPASPALSQTSAAGERAADRYGRNTPEGAITGFVSALADEDYLRASHHLDLSGMSSEQQRRYGPALAEQLGTLLGRGGHILPRAALSDMGSGSLNDGLSLQLDRVGRLETAEHRVDLLVERVALAGDPVWLIADETLSAVPKLLAAGRQTPLDKLLPDALRANEVQGAPLGHWLALVALSIGGYLASYLIIGLGLWANRWYWKRRHLRARSFLHAIAEPLQLWGAVLFVYATAPRVGVSVIARETFARALDLVGWFAFAWLLWRIIDAAGTLLAKRLQGRGRDRVLSLSAFVRRLLKTLIFALALVAMLDSVGYDVTAGIAALGIGGLALALGAQKTVENFIAGVTVLADQPVRVGEFCKIGETQGTVEELGMRSTRIRTLEQTLVVIPNSDFAAKQIENYSRREQFWFHPMLNLRLDTKPELVRIFLERVRSLLAEHPCIDGVPPRVRLLGVGNDRLPIEVYGFVHAPDYDDFLRVQEDLTLGILDLVHELGMELSAPTTQIAHPASFEPHHGAATDPTP